LIGSLSDAFGIPSPAAGHFPSESSPTLSAIDCIVPDATSAQLESLSLQLDPAIGTSSLASVSAHHSPVASDKKQPPDSRSQFILSEDVPDLHFHGVPNVDASHSNNTSTERMDDKRLEPRIPDDAQGGEDMLCAPDVVTPTSSPAELDDTLRTPRKATPPRATPPLPPTRSRLAPAASCSSGSSPVKTCVSKEVEENAEESPHSAAEQVLNTLVGFVVHSWSEDEHSGDDVKGEKHSPVSVTADTSQTSQYVRQAESDQPAIASDEEQHHTIEGETDDRHGGVLEYPTVSSPSTSSKSNVDEQVQTQAGVAFEPTSEVDEDAPLDLNEDYAHEHENDEMALLLVARIAVFKEALRRMKEQEARNFTYNGTV